MSTLKKRQEKPNINSFGYAKLLTPKGNEVDGYTVSNDFEKVFFKYSSQGLDTQAEEMMNDWIINKVVQEEAAIFQGISSHHRIKV
ncbi:hypothetical protein [Aeromonas salmonicida]|uniref:hypothetical protein n=1 Tax=Aeromonas salmonicida TaxID=645 RepID=UPI0039A46CFC